MQTYLPLAASTSGDSPLKPVQDFFSSGGFQAITKLFGLFLVALWLSLAFWVFKDARRRMADPVLVFVAVATALVFPYVGALIYLIVRPPEYLEDVRERELEIRAMERSMGKEGHCPTCYSEVEASFLSCPVCTTKLREACRRCKAPLDPQWRICPYCETSVRGAAVFEDAPAESPYT